ncbi:hypothetical protein LIER_23413 [Lithospermum erythrorhizon]|uniref:Uncharacterized protein n=1 Tax=Lithospermum erythrorhizon TaxID=34254 RepID=A0AAV3R0L7_LITER
MHPSPLGFESSGSSKSKHSLDSFAEDRDQKHARGPRKEASSSHGSRMVPLAYPMTVLIPIPLVISNNAVEEQVVELSSSASELEHTDLVDTGESPECFATEKHHGEVQEAATIKARARDIRVQAQGRRSVVTHLDLEAADTSQRIHTLEERVRAERAKHLVSLSSELKAPRLDLLGLL